MYRKYLQNLLISLIFVIGIRNLLFYSSDNKISTTVETKQVRPPDDNIHQNIIIMSSLSSSIEEGSIRIRWLPSPDQTWAHAVSSQAELRAALEDATITAIETDLLMGKCTTSASASSTSSIPIMAHPPDRESDLSMTQFWDIVSTENLKGIHKVIKLDFKELETVEPTLKEIVQRRIATIKSTAIFLNADILPGPGRREPKDVTIPARQFLDTCLKYIGPSAKKTASENNNLTTRFSLSLGFKADCMGSNGYTQEDMQTMSQWMIDYQLEEKGIGVVLALNARQLSKSLSSLDSIMKQFPHLGILAWTGKGEPPISRTSVQLIQDHFERLNMSHRIGFDCQVSQNLVEL